MLEALAMTKCSNDHPPILHEEFWCPLCELRKDYDELDQERDRLLELIHPGKDV